MKQLIGNGSASWTNAYTFSASARTVTLTGVANLPVESILLINNISRNQIIYNPFSAGVGYTAYSSNDTSATITLEFDTSSYSDLDKLQIFYDNSDEGKTLLSGMSAELKALNHHLETPFYADISLGGVRIASGAITTVTTVSTVSTVSAVTTINGFSSTPTNLALTDPLLAVAFGVFRDRITIS